MMHAHDVIEVVDALESAGIDVWLQGGWGVDALLGAQTRPHDDLDVIIRADDSRKAMQATAALGFSVMTDDLPRGFVVRDDTDRRVDFHPVRFRSDGSAVQQGIRGEWVYSAPGLRGIGSIDGRSVRCLTPEEQAARATDQPCEAGYEPDDTDRRDMHLLRERFGIPLPFPFHSRDAKG